MSSANTLPNVDDDRLKALIAASGGMPSVSGAAAPPVGIPSVDPSLAKPTPAQSRVAGKAEYASSLPTVTAQPFTPEYYQQQRSLSDFKAAHPLGSDISARPGIVGKIEHGLAKVGNIAGDIIAPGAMAMIPGTDLYNNFQRSGQQRGFTAATAAEEAAAGTKEKEAETQNLAAETAKTRASIGGWQPLGEPKQDPKTGEWFQPAKDASGNVRFEPLPGGPPNPPNTTGKTPADRTYDSLLTQVNPATGKNYTNQEALAEVTKVPATTEAADDARFEKILTDANLGKPVSPDDNAWAKAYRERKAIGPQASAAAGAQNATLTPLINPTTGELLGTFNTKTGEMRALPKGGGANAPLAGATTAAGASVGNKQTEAFNKDYVNPAEAIERSYQMFQEAYKAIQSGDAKTGAEDMLLLSQHLGTTFGQVKGSRMNKDLIQEHKDAIGLQERIERYANNLASGAQLSPDQRQEFGNMISNMRQLTWQIATKEAARNNQPIDFLPPDVKITMRDSKGVSRPVPGDRVQEYLNKGARLGG